MEFCYTSSQMALTEFQPRIRFPFSLDKGVAMLEYLLKRVGGQHNYMALLKLAFFADRYHTRKHARSVSMDQYFAFPYGPGGSTLKDILLEPEVIFFGQSPPIERPSRYEVKLVSDKIDSTQFSKSDIAAMEFSLSNFNPIARQYRGEFILSDISHAYPEWDRYAELFDTGKTKREDIYYEDFLKNPDAKHPLFLKHGFIDPFDKLSLEEQEDLLDEMREYGTYLTPPVYLPPTALSA